MAGATLTTITPILKELYEGPIANQIQAETLFTQRIESTAKGVVQKAGGKYVDFPIRVGRNQGISFRQEGETLGDPGQARMLEANVTLKYGYGRGRINGQVFEIAETDRQAFANAVEEEMDSLKTSVAKDQNRIYYGDGTGVLASITVTANSATQTVDSVYWLEVDQVVDVLNSSGTKIGTAVEVDSIDYDNSQVTLSASVNATGGTHFIVRAGNYDSGTQREPTGLARMTDNTVNLYSINDAQWKAVNRNLAGSISESAMIRVCDDKRLRFGTKTSVIFTSLGVRRAYLNLLQQQRQFCDTMDFAGGWTGIKFNYGGKDIPIVDDPDCPAGRMYFLDEKELRVYHTKDWHFEDKTGSMFTQVSNKDQFDFFMKRYFELGVRTRGSLGVLRGITEN